MIPAVPVTLYHYTCLDHGHPGIYGSGFVRPGRDGLVWLTDLDAPVRDAIGLTRVSLNCDRGAARYRVENDGSVVSWIEFRKQVAPEIRDELEMFFGAMPMHWFVAWHPLDAVYDPIGGPRG